MSSQRRYTVVDLFCGCGGLTRGLERTGRFVSRLGVDINATALATFKANHGHGYPPATWQGDIRELNTSDIFALLKIEPNSTSDGIDLLVGGPPCEGFSRNKTYTSEDVANVKILDPRAVRQIKYSEEKYWSSAWSGAVCKSSRRLRAYNPFLADPRNFLFRDFLRVATALRPKAIIIENVRQILEHNDGAIAEELLSWFSDNGYRAEARVINAAEYGVPQQRLRAFFLALRNDVASSAALPWPQATHSASEYVSLREAISDLPPPTPKTKVDDISRLPLDCYAERPTTAFQRFVRIGVSGPANHIYRTPSEQVLKKIRAMKPGMRPHHLPKELQPKKYYYNSYGRLEWDKPANTITKSFLYPGSGRFCHPVEDRVISYREAARLQSFDDDFTFVASSQEGLAHMIGSAVPPLLGYRFGIEMATLLDTVSAANIDARAEATPKRPRRTQKRRIA